VYDGEFRGAEGRLADLARAHPDDPVAPYLQALALEWRLEQDRESRALDASVLGLADRALALADARLGRDPADGRALLARGAAHGVKSRLHLFRWERGPASREAVRMREGLLAARAAGVHVLDLDFGLGLYDYYADTLPRFFKIVAFLLRIPGGDRERGLASIARVAHGGSLFHDDEARVQMFDIFSYFERKPDRAVFWIREMWRRHPGWPLWGLKLADYLDEPLGLFDESAAVAREILAAVERGDRPNYQPIVGSMARVLLGEALLGQGRFAEARAAAAPACSSATRAAWVVPRAEIVVARSLEMQGRLDAAERHYRLAAAGGNAAAARRAREALDKPASSAERAAAALLAEARRLRGASRDEEALARCMDAFRAFPSGPEGRLCAARNSLDAGNAAAARSLARAVLDGDGPDWLRPQAQLLLGEALERLGDKGALDEYERAWSQPYGRPALRLEAAAGIRRLRPDALLPDAPPFEH
jgi:tetratricopeptide (TPR) repeat protein